MRREPASSDFEYHPEDKSWWIVTVHSDTGLEGVIKTLTEPVEASLQL